MTSEQPGGRPAARHQSRAAAHPAEPGGTPPAGPQEMAIPAAAGVQDGAATSAPPDDPQELREEIERTRERLGQTVEALAAKADVKARAQAKAAQLTGRLKSTATQAKQRAAARAGQVQRQLGDKAAGPGQQAAAVAAKVSAVTPEPVQRATAKAAAAARQRRVPLAVGAGAVVLAWLVIARWRRR